jgi:hypothetical protein
MPRHQIVGLNHNIVTDLMNALPGNSSIHVNTARNPTIDEAVFSMWYAPRNNTAEVFSMWYAPSNNTEAVFSM